MPLLLVQPSVQLSTTIVLKSVILWKAFGPDIITQCIDILQQSFRLKRILSFHNGTLLFFIGKVTADSDSLRKPLSRS